MKVPETGYYRFYGHAYHLFRFYLHGELMIEEYSREIDGIMEMAYDLMNAIRSGKSIREILSGENSNSFLESRQITPGSDRFQQGFHLSLIAGVKIV